MIGHSQVTKYTVLLAPTDADQLRRGLLQMPFYCFFVFGTIWGFLFMKGIPAFKTTPYSTTAPLTVGLGVVHGLLGYFLVSPWLKRTVQDKENLPWYSMAFVICIPVGAYGYYGGAKDQEKGAEQTPENQTPEQPMIQMQGMPMMMDGPYHLQQPTGTPVMGWAFGNAEVGNAEVVRPSETKVGQALKLLDKQELFALREQDAAMHAAAFCASSDSEEMFKFLQLSSCCLFSLSHGANDVANAIGPFSTVWMIYSTGRVSKKADVPIWILIYGGIALDIGLITMGHQIMSALGNRLTLQTPSRGYCIELGAMFCVMIASRLGIPVSTTHCITGSTVAVGLCNGTTEAVNLKLFAVILFGWLLTCPCAGIVTGLLFWGICSAPRPEPTNGYWQGKPPPLKPPSPAPSKP